MIWIIRAGPYTKGGRIHVLVHIWMSHVSCGGSHVACVLKSMKLLNWPFKWFELIELVLIMKAAVYMLFTYGWVMSHVEGVMSHVVWNSWNHWIGPEHIDYHACACLCVCLCFCLNVMCLQTHEIIELALNISILMRGRMYVCVCVCVYVCACVYPEYIQIKKTNELPLKKTDYKYSFRHGRSSILYMCVCKRISQICPDSEDH